MKFIFNMNAITKTIETTGYDPKKMPLGNLSEKMILDGFSVLEEIEKAILAKNTKILADLSDKFY
jgi:hypothetical protein